MPRYIRPQTGPQERFVASEADIAIYGGSAGGGKSFALAYSAAQYVNVPGYSAVLFRRTSPELTGGGSLWEESKGLYRHLRGEPREHPNLDWHFYDKAGTRTGARVEFRHAQHEHSVTAHQSKQYDFIGIDELTQFMGSQFWFLLSRLRSPRQVPKRMRGTCNPDPDSFVRELIDWWIGEDGLAIESRSGVIRWFVRLDERLVWGASPDAVWQQEPHRIRRRGEPMRDDLDVRPEPMSFTFIRARLADNKILLKQDPAYGARLNLLPGALAKRMRDGNWNARDSAGDYFNRDWCRIIDAPPERNIRRRIRFWDKAATTPSPANPDPDYTRGTLLLELDDGTFCYADRASVRGGPGEVDKLMRDTARMDGIETEIGAWVDPGQAGKVDEAHMQDELRGFAFEGIAARRDKTTYAGLWTGLAKTGRLVFVRRAYLPELFAELEGFPLAKHDDSMDSLSGGFFKLFGGEVSFDYDAADDPRHPSAPRDAWDDDDEDDEERGSGYSRGAYF